MQLCYTYDELMSDEDYEEPLFGGEVRCHGGYVDGHYLSPRARLRRPAIAAWRQRLVDEGQPIITIPDDYVPPHYPSVEQAKYLLQEGLAVPIVRTLTTISIVEGFGARIRELHLPDLAREIREDLEGTTLDHLSKGLIEAHARDEAGHRDQGGHKQMWEAARDLGLGNPAIPGDVLLRMMGSGGGSARRERAYPDLSPRMEEMIRFMASILIVETFAENAFAWAIDLLGDAEVSEDVRAAHLIECVQADEKPHVGYLTMALSELRARTLISEDGKREIPGADVVDDIFSRQLRGAATSRPRQARERLQSEIHDLIEDQARATRIASHFESLDSGWTFPRAEDEHLEILLT